jgi:acyl carrier protein
MELSTTSLEQDVKDLIADIIEVDVASLDSDANLVEDLGMDSMMALEILASLEKRFKIKLPEDELPKITTVNRAIEVAKKYVK